MISAAKYYEQYTEEEIEDGDYTPYEEYLADYGEWLYEVDRDNKLCG
jgi:hypothetical protein